MQDDLQRWDARYADPKQYENFVRVRPFLSQQAARLQTAGLALDVAMGLGGNAGYLLSLGWRVIGVDISGVALRRAKANLPELMAVQADLTRFYFPPCTYDLITNFFYLERSLWPQYEAALKPGGLLVFETLTLEMRLHHPDLTPQYYLEPGELAQGFPGLETLDYWEGWSEGETGHRRAVAALLARKPGQKE